MRSANAVRFLRAVTALAAIPPDSVAGAASMAGPRAENQDCAGAAIVQGRLLGVAADGLGGPPEGARASLSACCHVLRAVRRSLTGPGFGSAALLRAVADAFDAARHGLAGEGRRRGFSRSRPGYCSTLIVLLADQARYVYGYVGDGALVLRRADGRVSEFLRPQRRPGARSILAAHLGPDGEGEPEFGVVPREPGDLFLLGTDGLFDVAPARGFSEDFHRQLKSSVPRTVRTALQAVARAQDGDGLVVDDNLSLVAIRTPGRNGRAV